MTTALIAIAGAAGAVVRYRLGVAFGVRAFPWATLAINISGSFLLTVVLAGPAQTRWSSATSAAVAVGFLGAYTTFSTFGYETLTLVRTDRLGSAVGYVTASLLGGLVASGFGYVVGRAFT